MNPNTHIYLYAKGHYITENTIKDLKKIVGERSHIDPEFISLEDILVVLLNVTWRHVKDQSNPLRDFLFDCRPENRWKIVPKKYVDDNYDLAVIHKCLSIIRFTEVKDLNLGEADSKILPLKKHEEETENGNKISKKK